MNSTFDPARLISTLAFALRHDPSRFGLDLDEAGWTSFENLVIAIRFDRYDWASLDESVIAAVIAGMDRFEIRDGKIRAVYGHSIALAKPPARIRPFYGRRATSGAKVLDARAWGCGAER